VTPVRRFRESDWDELSRLSVGLFPDEDPDDLDRHNRSLLTREDAELFVAERPNGSLCGFVEAGTRPYVDGCDTSPVGYIEAWYVDADMRRSGVGRALLSAAERWAIDRGYTEMGSDATLDNIVSHRAHIASGYAETDRIVQFRKDLK
jgi:aminoglycoside 6'-N-acetyltransferase I